MLNIEKLIAEARAIPDSEIAEPPVTSHHLDHVVGVLSEQDLKKIFQLMMLKFRAFDEEVRRFPEDERTRANPKLAAMDDECTRVKDLFWTEIRLAYPETAGKNPIGIRRGWKVVWSDRDPIASALITLLRGAA